MNARESDPMHDDNITQEEFKQAATMNFPTITIPDPVAVGAWLDEQVPSKSGAQQPSFDGFWSVCHWHMPTDYVFARADTPEALLADIRAKLAEHDPLDKLRKDAEAHGYELTPKAP